jgi:hypothetical protein
MTSTDLALPQTGMDDAFKAFAAQQGGVESLSEGITGSYGVIGYKGKNWSLRYKGEKYNFKRADDGTPAASIDVIILRSAKQKSKSFYTAYDEHQSEGQRPICASLDGLLPDDDVVQKQSETCALCPRNQWRTNDKGKKVKDCSDYKRLAVLLAPSQTVPFFGSALLEPVFLRVPAASLEPLANYGDDLARQGFSYFAVVTRVMFEPDTAHPKFMFKTVQVLGAKDAPVVIPMINEDLALRVTGEDKANRPQLTHTLRQAIAGSAATASQPTPGPATQVALAAQAASRPPAQEVLVAPPAQIIPPKPAPAPAAPPPSQDGSLFGGVSNLPLQSATTITAVSTETQQRVQPTTQTQADVVGEPGESTPDLDAAIANILKL